ncbi:hypothetical protein [Insolitispirillum peregrinum]|uniref:hypothetical protein n=1 Tax=Insolitispirillum peregrinum TaxID=80876 RepID=UPI003609AE61
MSSEPVDPVSLPSHTPISLKSLSLDAKGNLARRRMVGPLDFSFQHQQRSYFCRFYERSARSGLVIHHRLGQLPKDRKIRALIRTIVRQARSQQIGLVIRRTGEIDLEQRSAPPPPVNGVALLAHISRDVLLCLPWMELVEDVLANVPVAE